MLLLLEPRLVFDAAAGATAADAMDKALEQAAAQKAQPAVADCQRAAEPAAPAAHVDARPAAAPAAPEPLPAAEAHTLVFIDSRVADSQALTAGLTPGAEAHVIAADQDGAAFIAQTLAGRHDVASVQIFGHGAAGMLTLGATHLDAAALSAQGGEAGAVRSWAGALSADADILVYGCSTGAGAEGRLFVDRLATLTGADVAAASHDVGAAGGFDLDVVRGVIQTHCALSERAMADYAKDLSAAPVITDAAALTRGGLEDVRFTLGGDLAVTDADSSTLTVTLTVTKGTLSLADAGGLTVSGDGSRTLTFAGDVVRVNAALQGVRYQGDADYAGADTLGITVKDDANLTTTRNVGFNVTPVNDAPTLASPATPFTVPTISGGYVNLSDAGIGLSDIDTDAASRTIRITALPGQGYLELSGAKLGVGSTFDGSKLSSVRYVYMPADPTAAPAASDSFGISVDDGLGGAAAGSVAVRFNAAPTVEASLWVSEGQQNAPVSLKITDPDQAAGAVYTLTIVSLPGEGTLKYNGANATAGQTFTSDQISKLTYSHWGNETNRFSPPSFTLRVTDDGRGSASGKASVDTLIKLTVLNSDRDPTLETNAGLTMSGTGAGSNVALINYTLLKASDVDSATGSLVFTLSSEPSKGRLLLDQHLYDSTTKAWVDKTFSLKAGSSFSMNDLYNNRVRYEYTSAATGAQTDGFSFSLSDGSLHTSTSLNADGTYSVTTSPGGLGGTRSFSISIGSTVIRGATLLTNTDLTPIADRYGNQAPKAHDTGFIGLDPLADQNNGEVTIRETGWKF